MPRLTPSGVPVFGLGRIPLDDSRVIGQQIVDGDWRICVDGVPVSPQGCNALAASNGYWIAWLAGYGLFDASGLISATAGLPATQDGRSPSAPDGTIAIVTDRDNGRGLALIGPGRVVSAGVPDALLTDQLCVVNSTQALWLDAGTRGLRTCGGLPAPSILPGPMGWPHVLTVNGELWLSYQSTDAAGMVLHPFTSFRGYRIALPPAFYQDAIVLPDGKVRLIWARTPADTDIDVRDIDVAREPRIDLTGAPQPQPNPEPKPEPKPEPSPMPIPNKLSVVQAVRAKYPTPLGAQHPAFLIEVANATGAKLLRKDGGTHVTLPNGTNVSQDILMFGDQGVDILGDGEGAATPGWIEKGSIAGEYIDVSGMGTPDIPPPPKPDPPPPVVDLSEVIKKLDAISATVAQLKAFTEAISQDTERTQDIVEAIRDKPPTPVSVQFPAYVGALGYRLRLTPEEKK